MAVSLIKNPNALAKQNTGSDTPFKWYKFGRVVFCCFNANSISTTTVSGSEKLCDIPSGFEPIASAESLDGLHSGRRIQFNATTGIVESSEVFSSQNIRGSICYISAN